MAISPEYTSITRNFFWGKKSSQEDGEVGGDEEDEAPLQLGWIETSIWV